MKKFLALLLAVLMVFGLVGCGGGAGEDGADDVVETADIVFLCDLSSVYDGGFNEFSYYGVRDFAEKAGLTYTYLQPAGDADDAARETIFLQAVENLQAKVVVAVGYLWDAALLKLVPEYPDVKIIYADADNLYNIDVDYDGTPDSISHQDHLAMITFDEQDVGFEAGYALVQEGFTKLGFLGGMAVPAVIRFGYGFLDGVEYAAKELNLSDVEVEYFYTGTFDPSSDIVTRAASWYTNGTEIIFSCGGTIVNSVIEACQAQEGKYICGVDSDEYFSRAIANKVEGGKYDIIVTSAMKDMETTIAAACEAAWAGGDAWAAYADACTENGIVRKGAADNGVCLAPYRAENWKNLTQAQYDAVHDLAVEMHSSLTTDTDGENGAPVTANYSAIKINYYVQ